jgi:hypothetical protein
MGPQTEAWLTPADELYYGGQAGGGKSDLLLGLALTAHQRSVIFRKEYTQFRGGEGLFQRSYTVIKGRGHYSSRINGFLLNDGRTLEFGAIDRPEDMGKWRGRAHDFKGFDELPELAEQVYLFLAGWLRSTDPNQRTRIVGAGNPPLTVEGEWVLRRWGPWLDPQHAYPALPGEIRWFARIEDKDTEVEGPALIELHGEQITPRSRSFIPASLSSNVYLSNTDYRAQLASLPEPLRSQLLYGDFTIGVLDDPWQVIPTSWVDAAMRRWKPSEAPERASCAGLDVARGGAAKTVLSQRFDEWFAPIVRVPGKDSPDADEGTRLVLQALARGGYVNIDVIGPGAAVVDLSRKLVDASKVIAVNFGAGVKKRDRTSLLKFVNVRAFAYWSLREALDPETGDNIMLPPDPELKADLCAARYMLRVNGIQVEAKDEIVKRLGRSPDAGDAVVLAAMPPVAAGVAFY